MTRSSIPSRSSTSAKKEPIHSMPTPPRTAWNGARRSSRLRQNMRQLYFHKMQSHSDFVYLQILHSHILTSHQALKASLSPARRCIVRSRKSRSNTKVLDPGRPPYAGLPSPVQQFFNSLPV